MSLRPGYGQLDYAGGVRRRTTKQLLLRIVPYLKMHKRLVSGSIGATVFAALASLAAPWPLAFLIDGVLRQKGGIPSLLRPVLDGANTGRLVLFVVVATLIISLLENGSSVFSEYVTTKLDQKLVLDFRGDLLQEAQRLPFSYHDKRRSGDWIGRIVLHSSAMGEIPLAVPAIAQSLLTLVGMFAISLRINVPLALITLSVAPFIYYSIGYYGKNIVPKVRATKGLELIAMNTIYEAMSMIRVVVAFCLERFEFLRFRQQGETALRARVNLTVKQAMFSMVVNLLTAIGTAAVMFVGAWDVIHHTLSVGSLIVIMSYVSSIYKPLQDISSSINTIQEQLVSLDMAIEIVDAEPDVVESPNAKPLPPARGEIEFQNVDFSYLGRRKTLQDISFNVAPGSRVAIVGPTGAGKSTLANLMIRFHDPKAGSVRIDGHDLKDLTIHSLRSQIAIVLQEPLLFRGSIAENIRYGDLEATMDDIQEAAEAANAHGFISELPRGYQAQVGERGATLSGGERQRISIARAFLKKAPVLILDEPTSSIDAKTEKVILDALERLMEGRTTFMITHRLSSVRDVDQVLVLDRGRLVQSGTPEQLSTQRGMYRRLCLAQGIAPGPMGRPAARSTRKRGEPVLDGLSVRLRQGSVDDLGSLPRHQVISSTTGLLLNGDDEDARTALRTADSLSLQAMGPLLLVAAVRRPSLRAQCLDLMKRLKPKGGGVLAEIEQLTGTQRRLGIQLAWRSYGDALIPALRSLAESGDAECCRSILDALAASDHPQVASVLLAIMERDLGAQMDARAFKRLLELDPDRAVGRVLESDGTHARALAAGHAARDVDIETVGAVINAAGDVSSQVREAALSHPHRLLEVLGELPSWKRDNLIDELSPVAAEVLVEDALALLGSRDPESRMLALRLISRTRASSIAAEFADSAWEEEPERRLAVTSVLAELRSPRAIPTLRRALGDSDVGVRSEAIWGLAVIEDEQVIPPLIEAMFDFDARVQVIATESLVRMKLATVDSYLVGHLKDPERNTRIKDLLTRRALRSTEPLVDGLEDAFSNDGQGGRALIPEAATHGTGEGHV